MTGDPTKVVFEGTGNPEPQGNDTFRTNKKNPKNLYKFFITMLVTSFRSLSQIIKCLNL